MKVFKEYLPIILIVVLGSIMWRFQPPVGLKITAYHTAIVFIGTILAIIANCMPTGATALVGLTVFVVLDPTAAGNSKGSMLAGLQDFDNALIWLIVIAFMMARAFQKTGLGRRIALTLLSKFGQSSLRVAYCLGVADFLIAPATPSNTARAAIVSPIADALAKAINKDDSKLGRYLISNCSAMNDSSAVGFSTGFAGNIALVGIAASVLGITLNFGMWAMYLLVPALALLLVMPLILYKTINPDTKKTPEAPEYAKKELTKMGKVTNHEKGLLGTFVVLVFMWVFGSYLGIYTTVAAFIGLSALLLMKVLTWDDIKSEKGAWDTLVWFSILMGMANHLKSTGFSSWVGSSVSSFLQTHMTGASPTVFLIAMMTFYLFTAYCFASGTAKVMALAPVIITALVSLGVAPLVAVLSVAGITNVGCNLSTYSHARNPLLLGYGYHTNSQWMKIGLVIAICAAVIFMTVGLAWWSILGIN
ncbi:DASS family sodium-coupled anion symporter [Vibrio marisflavi]|uniref:Malate transporter YflS n=1 Tax=Vibrio marisflavi CECT 7928 TaxID=634439 RepID=A0ABM8ZZL4_9VIBR|nr:DASS family sodium-coupled anion symporter [Vibrio marisflavi]CAH0536573.1 Putative malate transporter YflS [Vibrio marisflavi CECT 7928]